MVAISKSCWLEIAEIQALNQVPMTMRDWQERLHQFLSMTGRGLLTHAGNVSHDAAMQKASEEYEAFRIQQLREPTEVEKHFIEAEKKLKMIVTEKKSKSSSTDKKNSK